MLKRWITALVLLAVLLAALLGGRYALLGLLFVCQMLCMWEMLSAVTAAGYKPVKWVYLLYGAGLVPCIYFFGSGGALLAVTVGFLAALTLVTLKTSPGGRELLCGLLPAVYPAIPLSALCLLVCRRQENWLLYIYLTVAVPVASDSCALFAGKAFGKHKLIPRVSPHKTVEGAVGGVAGSVLISGILWGIAGCCTDMALPALWVFLLIGFVGAFFSEAGDLAASYIKRVCGVKDFGKIFPGHGGMLDRLDSILFMGVWMLLVLSVFGI